MSRRPLLERHPGFRLAANVPCAHAYIPFKHADVIAATVDELVRAAGAASGDTGKTPAAE